MGIVPYKSPCPVGHLLPSRPLCHFVTFPHTVGNHPFQGRLKDSSALTGTSSRRGGFLLAPLQRSWQAVGLTEESRANGVRTYGGWFTFLKRVGRCGHCALRDPPALTGIPLFKGGFRANSVRPYGGVAKVVESWGEYSVPENEDSPEGGTGGCCRRKGNRFSPLDWGVGLGGEHAAVGV